jgi:uroporphyrinogen-III synthase
VRELGGTAPPGVVALCIGPLTARTAGEAGFARVVTAADRSAEAIVAAAIARLATAHPLP